MSSMRTRPHTTLRVALHWLIIAGLDRSGPSGIAGYEAINSGDLRKCFALCQLTAVSKRHGSPPYVRGKGYINDDARR